MLPEDRLPRHSSTLLTKTYRIIAAVGNLQMANLLRMFDNDYGNACAAVGAVYFIGLILIAFAPETKGKPLPD